jgi:hypothetical protein
MSDVRFTPILYPAILAGCFICGCEGGSPTARVTDAAEERPMSGAPDARPDETTDALSDPLGSEPVETVEGDADARASPSVELFNGSDFAGWDRYLGPPNGETVPIGLNSDPKGVFSVVIEDGAPAIHVTGEIWGALTTQREFENYYLRAEYKWGSHAVWPPLSLRDSGLMYHSVGPFGAVQRGGGMLADPPGSGSFMTSMEFQIAENDVGSFYSLGPISVEGGGTSVLASMQYENPPGSWNTVEVYALGSESVHLVNGHLVVHAKGAMIEESATTSVPLTRGKIQLQSESMEVFFRAVSLVPIESLPAEFL